jgi:GAF domain-containing protein
MSDDVQERESQQRALASTTFVQIIDSLGGTFDVVEVLTMLASRCVDVLHVAAAGILLADRRGQLQVIGSSSNEAQFLELFQIQEEDGPCVDCYRSGTLVVNAHLEAPSPWPRFAAASVHVGFPSVCAIPLRSKDIVLGCLNLFISRPVELPETETALARAFADVASIAIIQNRGAREAAIREEHLQRALRKRIVVEQAKGMIAGRHSVNLDIALARLQSFARSGSLALTNAAEIVVAGGVPVDSLISEGTAWPSQPDRTDGRIR